MSAELQLRVPKIQLTELSFTHPDPESFKRWQEGLPKANLGELSRQLYHCFLEFNQLEIAPERRLQLLEMLRPLTYFTLEGLSKHYLNSSLDLNPHQRKAANLAQSLQTHLAVGYKHVVLALASEAQPVHLSTALHRALTELSMTFLRACHLYCPTPKHLWLEAHQLFKLASEHQLLEEQVSDAENTPSNSLSLLDTYKRLLLFSLSNSNHLRQKEQQRVFAACSHWCKDARLSPDAGESMFAVSLELDRPPGYKDLLERQQPSGLWYLNTLQLRAKLASLHEDSDQTGKLQPQLPAGIDQSMLHYLDRAWGPMIKRSYPRAPEKGHLQLSIGFSATHFFLAGEEEFSLWLENQGSNRHTSYEPTSSGGDAWSQAVDVSDDDLKIRQPVHEALHFNQPAQELGAMTSNYPLFEAELIDSSPGGYSIIWRDQIPAQLQAGELIGIRQDDGRWHLAVVRWLRLQGSQKIIAGLQLLSPNARPGAIAVMHKSGGLSQFMRCFLLPDVAATGQQDSLLTPRISFQVGYKVRIVDSHLVRSARLMECCDQTGSFAQFYFHMPKSDDTTGESQAPSDNRNEQDFDNLWDKL